MRDRDGCSRIVRVPVKTYVGFTLCLAMSPLALAQSWPDEHSNPPFYYHADFPLAPLHPLLESVTNLKKEVPEQLGLQPLDEPVHVFLFQNQRTYRAYVKQYFPTVPQRPALFIKQRGPGMVFAHVDSQLDVDLRHETTHAVLHGILPMVPLWLDEGLGEYFEVPKEQRQNGHPHLSSIRKQVKAGKLPSITSLEKITELPSMTHAHYRDAWSWVHFLLHHSPATQQVLRDFLRDIESSTPPGSLQTRLRQVIPDYRQAYRDHFQVEKTPTRWRDRLRVSKLLGK